MSSVRQQASKQTWWCKLTRNRQTRKESTFFPRFSSFTCGLVAGSLRGVDPKSEVGMIIVYSYKLCFRWQRDSKREAPKMPKQQTKARQSWMLPRIRRHGTFPRGVQEVSSVMRSPCRDSAWFWMDLSANPRTRKWLTLEDLKMLRVKEQQDLGRHLWFCATAAEIVFVFRLVVLLLSFPFNLFLPKFVIIRHALLLVQSRLPRTTSDAICRYLLIGSCADPIQTDRRTPCVLEKGPQRGDDAVWWCLTMFVVVVVVLSSLLSLCCRRCRRRRRGGGCCCCGCGCGCCCGGGFVLFCFVLFCFVLSCFVCSFLCLSVS